MKKIYAVATESDVVLAFESRSDADEYAGEHDGMAVLPVPRRRGEVGRKGVAMGIICDTCGRDIDALGQDNMGVDAPLCEDCWGEQQGHAAAVLKRENASLSGEVRKLRFENARLREKLDAKAEKAAAHLNVEIGPALGVAALRLSIENVYETSRERALALTKLDECRLWLGCCEPKETAAPAAGGAAQEAAAPCLKEEGFATLGQDAMHKVAEPMLRMAVE